jgi:tellurite resistance protein
MTAPGPAPQTAPIVPGTISAEAGVADSWLRHVPVPLFAVGMGVTGLGIAWRKAAQVAGAPAIVGEVVIVLAAVLFAAVGLLYAAKALRHPQAVAAEFRHPIRSNFFAALSISLLLLSVGALPLGAAVALPLWSLGAAVHLGLTLHLLGRWIVHNHDIHHSSPAWFIPVVGNIVVPLAGVPLGQIEVSWFFFSVGVVFWIVLFTVIFYRVVFHDALPVKFVPTLFILIAPPAVGYLSWTALSGGGPDPLGRILVHTALFLTLLLATLVRQFLRVPFAVSWWAYTFPLAAITVATLDHAHRIASAGLAMVSWGLLGVTTVVVAVVLGRTAAARGTLFLPE